MHSFRFKAFTWLFVPVFALFFSLFACAPVKEAGIRDEKGSNAPVAGPDSASLLPGLSVAYAFGLWRHLGEMPPVDIIRSHGTSGPPVLLLDHTGDRDTPLFDSGRSSGVGMLLEGYIRFPAAGTWELRAVSNDGIRVVLNGRNIIEDPDVHADRPSETAEIPVAEPGFYPLEILYFQRKGTSALRLLWKAPGTDAFAVVPAEAYFHGPS